jgi:hypothetical protein
MLYPLSYEGLRPYGTYRRKHQWCQGVSASVKSCQKVHSMLVRAFSPLVGPRVRAGFEHA